MVITRDKAQVQVNRVFLTEYYYIADNVGDNPNYLCKNGRDYILLNICLTMCCRPHKIFTLYDCSNNTIINEKIMGYSHGHTDFSRIVDPKLMKKANDLYVVQNFFF